MKDGALKKRNQRQPAQSSIQKTKKETLKNGNKEMQDKINLKLKD